VGAKRRVQATLFVLLVLLIAVLATGIFATYRLYRSAEDRYVGVVLPLRTLTRDVLFQMAEEETGVRGYVLTTQRRSLDPYFSGRTKVLSDMSQIATLTRHQPELTLRLREVEREVRELHGFYDRLIVFVADGTLGQRQARGEVLDGDVLAANFRRTASVMQGEIDRFAQKTRSEQRATFERALGVLGIAGFFALAIATTMLLNVPERLRVLYAAEENARLRAEQGANAARALAHVSDAVTLVDDAGVVRSWNPAAERLFGVSADAALGRQARAVVPDFDRLAAAAERQDPFLPVRIESADRWLAATLSRFEGGSVLTVRDASAGYLLERTRADFVATASHELRTPLTSIYGGIRTLTGRGDQLEPEERRRLLHLIEQESAELARIVDQLLVSAQLDRGVLRLNESECDLKRLCAEVIESARARAPDSITLALDAPGESVPLRCDESLLRQVLVNLVENGVKYSPTGGGVELSLRNEPGRVAISVRDEGLGIPPAERERIFEKFYRVDAAMTLGIGGSGLGLYISRAIVAQMGGSLIVRPNPGKGSTFTVTLPRAETLSGVRHVA
jgi:two-component system, OmpR family, phosphate regulon sensor histidine kinase PhoR